MEGNLIAEYDLELGEDEEQADNASDYAVAEFDSGKILVSMPNGLFLRIDSATETFEVNINNR